MRSPRIATALTLTVLAASLAGCGSDDGDAKGSDGKDGGELTVLAAASLTDVYTELGKAFDAENGSTTTFSFGSSTDLAEQAADGAPGDVLSTADEKSMTLAEDAGVTGDVETFATNVLVIVTPPDNPGGIESLADLDGATWVQCVQDAPCGRVADAVLADNEITAEPASYEDDVRATLDKVVSGEADAGLVYASDAVAAGDTVNTIEIAGSESQLTSYFTTTLSQSKDEDLAEEWIEFLTSEEGQQALTEAGFGTP